MKKLFSVILCLVIIFCSGIISNAKDTVTVWSENVQVKNNRLFDVNVYVDCSFDISAATFEISYDKAMMEYREVSTEVVDGQVKASDKNGKVKAVFLKGEGLKEDDGVKLFSIKFKSVVNGESAIEISMYNCVDSNALEINEIASTQVSVTVSGSKSFAINSSDTKSKTAEKSTVEDETKPKSINYLSVASPKDSRQVYLIVIILLVMVIAGLMFYTSKLKNVNQKQTRQQLDNTPKDQDKPTEKILIENETKEKELLD